MLKWIKSITLCGLVGFCFGAGAQDFPIFEIPNQVAPGSNDFVLTPSTNPYFIDTYNFIEKSNETGLYPTYGWNSTGKYYETGVTHGPVDSYYWGMALGSLKSYDVSKSGSNKIYPCGDPEIPVVPEPSSLCFLLVGALEVLRRRRD